ncbi:glycosyltransferase family 4 protein [Arenibaculum pallidiluteum]|uniref:glycosyltransferase family 4 protein n=1 Tax=Arenibaculum pallidiluteum TaxID=2812559 RepID=UPI001A966F33|nr:glycosyltransferase family 4 protein [Arenibaculum pallidiluteum]
MRIVFIHQNMPGQFKHLARHLAADADNEVVFLTRRRDVDIPGVRRITYAPRREPARSTHRYLVGTERAVLHGQQVARVLGELKAEGFLPDIIYAHPGWGEALFIKDVFPQVPLLGFFEFYYSSMGADLGFDPASPASLNDSCRVRVKNITNLLSLEAVDAGISPTGWQASRYPKEYRYKLSVIFDGIDTNVCLPNDDTCLILPSGRVLTKRDEVVTYVSRSLEPYRGFPQFMRAVDILCRERSNAQFVVIGADTVSYGQPAPAGKTYRELALAEVEIDPERVHFLGRVPYSTYLEALRVSSAHVYLTYPFVLSWSMLEAMACGCTVVGSRTAPVEEVIEDGVNGWLVDFFDSRAIADRVIAVLDSRTGPPSLSLAARETVMVRYELSRCLAAQLGLIAALIDGWRPRPDGLSWNHHGAGVHAPRSRIPDLAAARV